MSTRVYKFISFSIKSIMFLLLLSHVLLYAWYRYELHGVNLSLYTQKIDNYKSDYHAVLWAKNNTYSKSLYEKGIKMKPIYPIYDFIMYILEINRTYYSYPSEYHPSYKVTYPVAKMYLDYRAKSLKKQMVQVWISHHLSFEEASNLYLEKAYSGHNYYGLKTASQGYFGKEPNELNIYQIMMLVALTENPHLDPSRKPQELMTKMVSLTLRLNKTFSEYYPEVADFKKAVLSGLIPLTVENSLEFMNQLKNKNFIEKESVK